MIQMKYDFWVGPPAYLHYASCLFIYSRKKGVPHSNSMQLYKRQSMLGVLSEHTQHIDFRV